MTEPKPSGLHVYRKPRLLFEDAAEVVELAAQEAVRDRGVFRWAVSGGSTPKALYELLDRPPRWGRIDWSRTQIFFGDERCVPPKDPASNFRMVRDCLLKRVPLERGSVHRIKGELPPEEAAEKYEKRLIKVFGGPTPRFDLVLLGMGTDGHTASLFPGMKGLADMDRLVVATKAPFPPTDRVSLTLRAINAARLVTFLVAGSAKSHPLGWVVRDKVQKDGKLPAAMVEPTDGRLLWLVDQAAAPFIKRPRVGG